jgi:hypothetical protein
MTLQCPAVPLIFLVLAAQKDDIFRALCALPLGVAHCVVP